MKNTKTQLNFILMAGMLVFISCNNDGNNRSPGTDTTITGNAGESREEDFVTDVIESNARLIPWLNAGISKGMDSELKSNAQNMLSDHETLRNELRDYAQKNNIILPDTDTSNIVDITDEPGIQWDEEWADEVGDDHLRLLNRFEQANKRIKDDTALKNIITKTLPVLQSHWDASKKLEDRLDKSN